MVEAFKGKYLPKRAREQKLVEFMRFHQRQMTVELYKTEFARLSKFALKIMKDSLDKDRRFRDGLKPDLCSQMISLNLRGVKVIWQVWSIK